METDSGVPPKANDQVGFAPADQSPQTCWEVSLARLSKAVPHPQSALKSGNTLHDPPLVTGSEADIVPETTASGCMIANPSGVVSSPLTVLSLRLIPNVPAPAISAAARNVTFA